MWKVSTDDISNLKQGLVSIFTDSFSSQLLNTTEVILYLLLLLFVISRTAVQVT